MIVLLCILNEKASVLNGRFFMGKQLRIKRMDTIVKENVCRIKFTLVEMLLVMAVIAVLTSMLLPALKTARGAALRISCSNNYSQIAQSANFYAADYDGYIPYWRNWVEMLNLYINEPTEDSVHHARANYNEGCFLCPGTAAPGNPDYGWNSSFTYSGQPFRTSYGLTTTAGSSAAVKRPQGGWQLYTDAQEPKKMTSLKSGSVISIEKGLAGSNWGIITVAYGNTAWRTNAMQPDYGVQYRHNLKANFLFNDGHIENLKQRSQFSADWEPK